MLFSLAFRNVLRNFRRHAPLMISIVLIFMVLIVGNALLSTTRAALYQVYARNISGDMTIGAAAESNFTLFGSDRLLVGQYLVAPTLTDYRQLQETLQTYPEVSRTAGMVTLAGRVEIDKRNQDLTLFGVDFSRYPDLVPGLKLEAGHFPAPGEPGIIVQNQGWKKSTTLLGSTALLGSIHGTSFTLREVPVTGIFSYPVGDTLLDTVALIDIETARALNGYVYGYGEAARIPEEDQAVLASDFDDLFGEMEEDDRLAAEDPVDPDLTVKQNLAEEFDLTNDSDLVDGAWNFLLISLHNPKDIDRVLSRLSADGLAPESGYLARGWSGSVGGNAQLTNVLQLVFNGGLLFVAIAAVIIAANALLLSILERTGEIGTLRAMGAGKARIAAMISIESLLVIFLSAVVGITAGYLALTGINAVELVIDNPYITILFGGKPLNGQLTIPLVFAHLAAALLLTLLSMIYPLKRALSIQPVKAMTSV